MILEIKIHEDYDPLSLKHDLALLQLQEVVEAGIAPVCFPDEDEDYANYTGVTTGWGRTKEGGLSSQSLREVEVPILSNQACSRLYPPGVIDETVICAGATNRDACQADSGGPLVVEAGLGRVVVGLVSWGRGCGRPASPGVYVRVNKYLQWIRKEGREGRCGYLSSLPSHIPSSTILPNLPCRCGMSNHTRKRIVGGTNVKVHEYPWQIAVVGYYQIRPFCGGVLISDSCVLTAAHCTHEMHHDDQVLLGEHKWNSAKDTKLTIRRNLAKIIVHPDFNKLTKMDSDIALLRLAKSVPLGKGHAIAPICLPGVDEDFSGAIGTVSGWGTVSSYGLISTTLKAAHIPILDEQDCVRVYGAAISKNMICAGVKEGGKDACQGDSGGPLGVEGRDGRWVLAGLVSWGRGCGRPDTPGVYVRVAGYVDWIKNHTRGSETCDSTANST